MHRRMMKSKIHRATVTDANLHYIGSITLDADLMAARRHPSSTSRSHVARHRQRCPLRDLRHPRRPGAGDVCLNGAAARLVQPGDKVIVITYADYEDAELDGYGRASSTSTAGNRPVDAGHRQGRRRPVGLTRTPARRRGAGRV